MAAANQTADSNTRRHFHTFDALRFFAFLKVFLLHLPVYSFPWFSYLKAGGGIGVQFFFVLSGFLITYIICEEKERTGKLNLKNFYVRRILRIWPLYYLMVLVAYATPYIQELLSLPFSAEGYEPDWRYSVFFLENYKMMITHDHANVSPLSIMWTLCIEEHYYLLWGLVLYYLDTRHLPKLLIGCVFMGLASRLVYNYLDIPTLDVLTNIDLFAYGAVPAYMLIRREDVIEKYAGGLSSWAKRAYVLFLIIVVVLCSRLVEETVFLYLTSVLGFLFAILIAFTLPRREALIISDGNIFSNLGMYTYGLYLYHILVVVAMRQVFVKQGWPVEEPLYAIVFITLALAATVICSYLSYHLFEKHFLKLKRYFRN